MLGVIKCTGVSWIECWCWCNWIERGLVLGRDVDEFIGIGGESGIIFAGCEARIGGGVLESP